MIATTMTDAIVEEITIKAPAARIFDALTNPQQLMAWWRREGQYVLTECELDLRPGGKWAMRGRAHNGHPFHVSGEYREIHPPRLLVFTWTPDWSAEATDSVVRWELDEKDGVTTVRLTHSGLMTEAARQSHRGWPQIVARLRDYAERA
jgi:uncharacterized protein YndB with AHSA1/START domain